MPDIRISISEQKEALIADHIRDRIDFLIDGGRVWDGEKWVFLKAIRFEFHKHEMPGTAALHEELRRLP